MTLRLLISLNLLLALLGAWAETADDFFHGGAMNYFSNNIPQALTVVTNGRTLFPNDEKLKKLEELLKQQQQQQQQDQQKQDQDKKDQQQQDQKDQQKKDEQNKQQPEPQKPQPSKQDQKKPDQQKEAKATPAGQMTPQQAARLLDAQKGEESALVFRPPEKPKDESKPFKDW